jgi:hypothetical protein
LRERIGLFENVVGRLQPILAQLPTLISKRVLEGKTKPEGERQAAVAEIENAADRVPAAGFDIDEVTDAELTEPAQPAPPLTMHDLERVIGTPALLPPGIEVNPLGSREYAFRQPGLAAQVRVSTDPDYYEQNADNVELWSPGNPTFPELPSAFPTPDVPYLTDLLGRVKP